MHSVRGSVVLSKPVAQSLLLQLREEKKGVESGQERGEERHPRRDSKHHSGETVDHDMRNLHGVALLTDTDADWCL